MCLFFCFGVLYTSCLLEKPNCSSKMYLVAHKNLSPEIKRVICDASRGERGLLGGLLLLLSPLPPLVLGPGLSPSRLLSSLPGVLAESSLNLPHTPPQGHPAALGPRPPLAPCDALISSPARRVCHGMAPSSGCTRAAGKRPRRQGLSVYSEYPRRGATLWSELWARVEGRKGLLR